MYENVDINKQFFLKDLLNYKKNEIDSKKILDSKTCKIVFFCFFKNKELELFNENEENDDNYCRWSSKINNKRPSSYFN